MARLSNLSQTFRVSYRLASGFDERAGQPVPQVTEIEPTEIEFTDIDLTESESTKSESTKPKSKVESEPSPFAIWTKKSKRFSAPLKRLFGYYKAHINELFLSNKASSPSEVQLGKMRVVDAGSTPYATPYGDQMATLEELNRQAQRNHLDYVFYLQGHNDSITNWNEGITLPHKNTLTSWPLLDELTGSEDFSELEMPEEPMIPLAARPDHEKWWDTDRYAHENYFDKCHHLDIEDTINGMAWIHRC